jgi:hypothetical protein
MTAKEKAFELVGKMKYHYDEQVNPYIVAFTDDDLAKRCALVAVNQMISMLPFTDLTTYIGKWCEQQRQYLEDVKQEIEKL